MRNKLWAIKMLFAWRYRLGYWDWDAFVSAWSGKTKYVYAWLVENGEVGNNLKYRCVKDGWPRWTIDPYEALWFCRRKDAESFSQEDEDAWRIVEHCFEVKA